MKGSTSSKEVRIVEHGGCARILGLDLVPGLVAVSNASESGGRLEIETCDARGRRTTFVVTRRDEMPVGFCTTESLAVGVYGQPISKLLSRLVPKAVESRLKGLDYEGLIASLTNPAADGERTSIQRAEAVKSLSGSRRAGGRAAIEKIQHVLGLSGSSPLWRIASVAWIRDHIEFSVAIDNDDEVGFVLEPMVQGSKGIVATRQLVLRYRGQFIPEQLMDTLRRIAADNLSNLEIGHFAQWMLDDPELASMTNQVPQDGHNRPGSQLDSWASGDTFADFFAGGEMAHWQLDSVGLHKFARNIHHSDAECNCVNPRGPAPIISLADFPWEKKTVPTGLRRRQASKEDWDQEVDGMLTTDINENDVIMGNPARLRDALDFAVRAPNPRQRPIFVANTCVPTVIGEDVESVVREYRRIADVPILYLTVTPASMASVLESLLVDERLRAEKECVQAAAPAVNLCGFPSSDRSSQELKELLRQFGVGLNCFLLPDIDSKLIATFSRASLSVFYPNSLWKHMYNQLLKGSRIPAIEPTAPFGIRHSRQWIEAVLDPLGLRQSFEDQWQHLVEPYAAAHLELTRRTSAHQLAVVVRSEESFFVEDPAQTWGVPIIDVLGEAGFGLEVFVHAKPARAATTEAKIKAALPKGSRHRVQTFATFEELRGHLRQSEASAVFSHHFFDWRVSEAGKARFSLQHFEIGPAGAVRTVERILTICETPFFRKYRRYLQRTPAGLRKFDPEVRLDSPEA